MARRSILRASDADREAAVTRLHRAATEGRIADDELETRVSAALRARTYADLDRTVADLPGSRHRGPGRRAAVSTLRAHPVLLLVAVPLVAFVAALVLAASILTLVVMVIIMVIGGPRVRHAAWCRTTRQLHPRRRIARGYWA